ncbi:AarF/ABC1/UbiB kinase family protein [uncultured Salinisphaera sp.]|uniref:ABC1 kinase family protein n=1 Tax=uncultured Salinisphaera sp. TaxID=359372 RepID=UPI0032B15806|tara:strand:+ start:1490 stop:2773 length:1284 start_codon:yes stop_codon:yes gene_type:complete
MASDNSDNTDPKSRRRRLIGAGIRTLSRGALRSMPGYDRAKSWQKTGQDWYDTLGGMKGAAMKLGQIASQYEDVLPPQITEQLVRLQRDAEPWEFSRLEPVLNAYWTDEERGMIAEIDEAAMAAASIGQVHAARLTDGREVVIKIRYPGVADSIDADVANLARLLKWSRMLPVGGTDLDSILGELRDRFVEETDYRRELANLDTLRQLNLEGFELPEAVRPLCNEAIFVSTRLDSRPIEEADPALGRVMIEAINRQIFELGALHADPHPGNYGVTERGTIALYDFGCVKYLDHDTRIALRGLLERAFESDWQGVHQHMEAIGAVPFGRWAEDHEVYTKIYARHAASAIDPLKAERPYVFERDALISSIRSEIGRSMKYWRYFRAAPDMVFVLRTLSGLYWILRSMHAEADLYDGLERIVAGEYGPHG